jgi:hypothetical protein
MSDSPSDKNRYPYAQSLEEYLAAHPTPSAKDPYPYAPSLEEYLAAKPAPLARAPRRKRKHHAVIDLITAWFERHPVIGLITTGFMFVSSAVLLCAGVWIFTELPGFFQIVLLIMGALYLSYKKGVDDGRRLALKELKEAGGQ